MTKWKLTFELVPEECWGGNLRSILSPTQWDIIRKDAYKRAGYQCRICGAKGRLEAHEVWDYDEKRALQKLTDVVALCKDCHEVKHISRTQLVGRGMEAMEHFMRVNDCSQMEFHAELQRVNDEYKKRNKIEGWTTDMSWLKERIK
ncbi:MAG: HNH endonuclease [Clostridiales bacterium]|nr:HNH endonuclease [Clostridiales bacterium]